MFRPESLFSNSCEAGDGVDDYTYWLTPNGMTGGYFVYDYGCTIEIERFLVKNAENIPLGSDRGTKDYTIEVSQDNSQWTQVAAGTLADVRGLACGDVPLEKIAPSGGSVATGRYVKFTVVDYYGTGGGALEYFAVVKKDHNKSKPVFFYQIPHPKSGLFSPVAPYPCSPVTDILYEDHPWDFAYTDLGAAKVLNHDLCDTLLTYWASPDYTVSSFVMDLGCQVFVDRYLLVNSHNDGAGDRSVCMMIVVSVMQLTNGFLLYMKICERLQDRAVQGPGQLARGRLDRELGRRRRHRLRAALEVCV